MLAKDDAPKIKYNSIQNLVISKNDNEKFLQFNPEAQKEDCLGDSLWFKTLTVRTDRSFKKDGAKMSEIINDHIKNKEAFKNGYIFPIDNDLKICLTANNVQDRPTKYDPPLSYNIYSNKPILTVEEAKKIVKKIYFLSILDQGIVHMNHLTTNFVISNDEKIGSIFCHYKDGTQVYRYNSSFENINCVGKSLNCIIADLNKNMRISSQTIESANLESKKIKLYVEKDKV